MRYACVLLVLIGCYSAPDYDGTHFKCDADHPCPAGQPCVDGVCNGDGNGSNTIDAAVPTVGVACGTMTCGTGQKCCADFLGTPSCMAMGATCAGISATCDGTEDCAGLPCCDGAGTQIACGTSPSCPNQTICRDNADCTNPNQPSCCAVIGTMEPWGRCATLCP